MGARPGEGTQPVEGGVLVRREGGDGAGVGVVAEQQIGLAELRYEPPMWGRRARRPARRVPDAAILRQQVLPCANKPRKLFVSC